MISASRPSRVRRFLLALALAAPGVLCAQNTWKAHDGDWNDPKNWVKNAVPSLKFIAPEKAAKKTSTTPKPNAKPTPAPTPTPLVVTPALLAASTITLTGGTASWNTEAAGIGDFATEVPVVIAKKAGFKQIGGPSWIWVRNGGSLTVTDGTFDGGTTENFIVMGGDKPSTVTVSGNAAVFTIPNGEIKIRRNSTFTVKSGNVSAKLFSFDGGAGATKSTVELEGGTITLTAEAHGGIYGGGDDANYVNFPANSKATLVLPHLDQDAVYEVIEKGSLRVAGKVDTRAFKVESRDGGGTKVTVTPTAPAAPGTPTAKP